MLNEHDTILVSVVGTEGRSRSTKHVAQRFDYRGNAVDEQGRLTGGPRLDLSALEGRGGAQVAIPDFPIELFTSAQRNGDAVEVARINLDYAQALQRAQRAGGGVVGGGVQAQYVALGKAVIAYLVRNEGFADNEQEAERGQFVLKAENVEITPTKVNGAVIYTVSGTAVFGK